jgi:hypothetical protein
VRQLPPLKLHGEGAHAACQKNDPTLSERVVQLRCPQHHFAARMVASGMVAPLQVPADARSSRSERNVIPSGGT